jgi:DNA-binding transcriptional MerR regulator
MSPGRSGWIPPRLAQVPISGETLVNTKKLKTGDIARITGMPEEKVREYADLYRDLIPSRSMGRIRLYDENAVKVFREIATLDEGGSDTDEVRGRLGGRKKGRRVIRPATGVPEVRPASAVAPSPASPPVPARQGACDTRLTETVALQEQQIKRLRARVEEQEKRIRDLDEELRRRTDHLDAQNDTRQQQLKIAVEWIEYFDRRLDALIGEQKESVSRCDEWICYLDGKQDTSAAKADRAEGSLRERIGRAEERIDGLERDAVERLRDWLRK